MTAGEKTSRYVTILIIIDSNLTCTMYMHVSDENQQYHSHVMLQSVGGNIHVAA